MTNILSILLSTLWELSDLVPVKQSLSSASHRKKKTEFKVVKSDCSDGRWQRKALNRRAQEPILITAMVHFLSFTVRYL